MKLDMQMTGFDDLSRDFNLLSDIEKRQVSKKAVRASAVVFREAVRNTAPVRTGKLKRAVSVDTVRGKDAIAGIKFKKIRVVKKLKNSEGTVAKRWTPFWWWILENGSSKMAAQPFVRPAFDSNVEKATKAGFDKYGEEINKVFSK